MWLLLLACSPDLKVRPLPGESADAVVESGTESSGHSGQESDSPDSPRDTGPLVLTYPAQRVGIFYLTWHAYAYDAVARLADPYTVEDVIAGGDLQFSDLILDAGLYNEAAAFHWHQEPLLGFYSLYRPRDGEGTPAEPNGANAYPDTAAIAAAHAAALWDAGIDFVYVDLTNLQAMSDFADVLGLRPLEVLIEEWGRLRAAGVPTPQIAAWMPLWDVGSAEPLFRRVLDAYDAAAPDLIFAPEGRPVLFVVDTSASPMHAAYRAEVEARGVVPVPMWGNLGASELAAGRAGWMQPCEVGGAFNTLITAGQPCAQGYTTSSPLGTVLSVSRSFQIGYASLPLQAAGRVGGLTFQQQMATAFAVQPDVLLINAWNEHIAQPQANPYDSALGPLRRSMGVTDATDSSADWLWVDMYGAEFDRDFEPTVQDGGAGYALLESCLRVYRSGARSCTDASEACCVLAEEPVLVRSVRARGGATSGDHVPTVDGPEVDALVASGGWEEVCNPHYGPPGLCGGGTTGDGPFRLYASGGAGRVALYRCYSGADHFLSTDAGCEGRTSERLLGYAATAPSSEMPRPLTRCLSDAGPHLHWIDGPCPSGTRGESILGYVR